MAYTKQTWIDGVTVADEDTLNHIENGIYNNSVDIENNSRDIENLVESTSRNIITIYAEERANYTLGVSNVIMSHFNLYNKVGNKLRHNNSSVVIDGNVNKVLVSANLSYWNTDKNYQCLLKILKNNIEIASTYFESSSDIYTTASVYLTPILIDVEKDDVLQMALSTGDAMPITILNNDIGRGNLTVEVID